MFHFSIVSKEKRVIENVILLCRFQFKLLQQHIIMGGNEYLHTNLFQFQQYSHNGLCQFGIQVGLWLIPEKNATIRKGLIVNQSIEQSQFSEAFGQQRKLQFAGLILQVELFLFFNHLARYGFIQDVEQTDTFSRLFSLGNRKISLVQNV